MNEDFHIKPLSPDNLSDFFSFFESVQFSEHAHWSICYCYSFHFTGPAEEWTRENNRRGVCELVQADQMKGYLAYHRERPVGWCNANNRLDFQRLHKHYDLLEPDQQGICSIVCFLIHQDYRRRGIARQLLDQIEKDYRSLGYNYLEAYPKKGEQSSEEHYVGPLEMYMKSGFKILKEFGDYYVVRKRLR